MYIFLDKQNLDQKTLMKPRQSIFYALNKLNYFQNSQKQLKFKLVDHFYRNIFFSCILYTILTFMTKKSFNQLWCVLHDIYSVNRNSYNNIKLTIQHVNSVNLAEIKNCCLQKILLTFVLDYFSYKHLLTGVWNWTSVFEHRCILCTNKNVHAFPDIQIHVSSL